MSIPDDTSHVEVRDDDHDLRESWSIAVTTGRYTNSIRMTEEQARLVHQALGERLASHDQSALDSGVDATTATATGAVDATTIMQAEEADELYRQRVEDLTYLITAHRFHERGLKGAIGEPDLAVARPLAIFLINEGYAKHS